MSFESPEWEKDNFDRQQLQPIPGWQLILVKVVAALIALSLLLPVMKEIKATLF